ncbi:MAG: HD domain-containing phosphohydrolase, partial [Actinomycetota bacterium]
MSGPHSSAHQERRPGIRLAEIAAALSLAGDMGLGQPWEHSLRTCLVALRLGEANGLSESDLRDLYYVALLRVAGCTADAHVVAAMVGDEIAFAERCSTLDGRPFEVMSFMVRAVGAGRPPTRRARMVARFLATGMESLKGSVRAGCEVAQVIAGRLGLGVQVHAAIGQVFERWDGRGWPSAIKGEELSVLARIVQVAQDWETFRWIGGAETALAVARERSGRNYDPAIVGSLGRLDDDTVAAAGAESVWDAVLAMEPGAPARLANEQLDEALGAFADFADLKSPFTLGHSRGVASLAEAAARRLKFGEAEVELVRHGALVHDLGRTAIPASIWEKPRPLAAGDWERVRLHPYYTERVLSRAEPLGWIAAVGQAHHERLDGSGYHRGSPASLLTMPARALAAADVYHAMTEPRPHRKAHDPEIAADHLREQVRLGRLDPDAVDA